ncbi:acyl-CoA thioesterase [uncultured Maribacter sp.]|uniref:acyl-CoA thioesterase n=1 Tax=uncultured Maribacter sp. TaxID=431308 RepID=UPI0030EBE55C|tara:strand:+ start:4253 stop:4747 length:495 start_codon:yes stop_codon:yes gene_type:complete
MKTKTPESKAIIRFPDCDPFNHLNNSKYIDYFINERENHLINIYDFDVYEYAKEKGLSWFVTQNQIAYFVPALLMEKVNIQTTILEWNVSDILVEMQMWNENKTILKSILWTRFTHYDLINQKSTKHNEFLNEKFRVYVNPIHEMQNFEKRIMKIKKNKGEQRP